MKCNANVACIVSDDTYLSEASLAMFTQANSFDDFTGQPGVSATDDMSILLADRTVGTSVRAEGQLQFCQIVLYVSMRHGERAALTDCYSIDQTARCNRISCALAIVHSRSRSSAIGRMATSGQRHYSSALRSAASELIGKDLHCGCDFFSTKVAFNGPPFCRFYLGHWQEGIGKLFSFGGLGVWTLIDVILISLHYLGPADGSLYI